ncbi:hypothetical protein [Rhizobium leguminosarum]|uniref:hypothetical protein n=1 Tax=Rhizobium leguminosarum TaxID=384 RepID=UPI0014415117|nr:hypothetical protein [Rhizobium leguminosarum]MBY5797716.1 hypothetical protein [Rhizobium leguminosarum]MBY5823698.1 hypothetical protein [Rhizobium leguminosarum]
MDEPHGTLHDLTIAFLHEARLIGPQQAIQEAGVMECDEEQPRPDRRRYVSLLALEVVRPDDRPIRRRRPIPGDTGLHMCPINSSQNRMPAINYMFLRGIITFLDLTRASKRK